MSTETLTTPLRRTHFADLKKMDQTRESKATDIIKAWVDHQIAKCYQDPSAANEPETVILGAYLDLLPNPEHDDYTGWLDYFCNAVVCNFSLTRKRAGAWAILAMCITHDFPSLYSWAPGHNQKLLKALTMLGIGFTPEIDAVSECGTKGFLKRQILLDLADAFDLPTDFNGYLGDWTHARAVDSANLSSITGLSVPGIGFFEEKTPDPPTMTGWPGRDWQGDVFNLPLEDPLEDYRRQR